MDGGVHEGTHSRVLGQTKEGTYGAQVVNVNKQDGLNPKRRSRFAAKGVNRSLNFELYAATPPPRVLEGDNFICDES